MSSDDKWLLNVSNKGYASLEKKYNLLTHLIINIIESLLIL